MGWQTHDIFNMHITQKDLSRVIRSDKVKEAPASTSQPKYTGPGDTYISMSLSSPSLGKGDKVNTLKNTRVKKQIRGKTCCSRTRHHSFLDSFLFRSDLLTWVRTVAQIHLDTFVIQICDGLS